MRNNDVHFNNTIRNKKQHKNQTFIFFILFSLKHKLLNLKKNNSRKSDYKAKFLFAFVFKLIISHFYDKRINLYTVLKDMVDYIPVYMHMGIYYMLDISLD